MTSSSRTGAVTFLFTDIEGSSRLWEHDPEQMRIALAGHDALVRAAIEGNHGRVVKTTGDGFYAVFDDALDGVAAALALQSGLRDSQATGGLALRVRCGLHLGNVERRDNDFFGSAVNRGARVMGAAHGGQVLLSRAVVETLADRLPQDFALRDLGTARLRDLAHPEHIFQLLHPHLRKDFPALRALEGIPNNLPQLVTSFIGREREVAEVTNLLDNARLLTLVGMGGLGKTRLSLQVAAEVMDDYPAGVWLVELAPLADARLVAQAVASVLGVKEEAGHPAVDAIVKHVTDRRLLLILDNCEHLLGACAELARRLLQSGPHVKILASSREPLHIAGETSYPVPSLTFPDPTQPIELEALARYESLRLFVERATAAQPAFQVTQRSAAAVSRICQGLDGIPLAIELAAVLVRALSVEQIAARLGDRFKLLTRGDQTALRRQQTLRALMDWSYDLLAERERALFRRLAVFAGGWKLDAAEAVGADGEVKDSDVLDLLLHLVEKSLVQVEAQGERYRLLETVRQYAQLRLDASGESEQARSRHLAFYLSFAKESTPKLLTPEQGTWLKQLDLERENLLAAHAWCERAADGPQLGLELVDAMLNYWFPRGLLELGYRVTVEAVERPGALERNLARSGAVGSAGNLSYWTGRYDQAQAYGEESLAIAREVDNDTVASAALALLGNLSLRRGDLAIAREHLQESLALAQAVGDMYRVAWALNALAELHRAAGEPQLAEPLYEQALVLQRERGNLHSCAIILVNLALVAIARGSTEQARQMLLEALAIAHKIGSKRAGQIVFEVSAGLEALRGQWQRAARLYGAAEAQLKVMQSQREPADDAFLAPLIARSREALGAMEFAAAEAAGLALSYDDAAAEALACLKSEH
ncbi:MAG: tetratricopeptide repeat protein [Casimicrobiaceae bacterium]